MTNTDRRGFMKKIAHVLTLLVALTTLVTTASVNAAQSNGLGITPRKDYSVQPGKSISDTVYISNLSLSQDLQVDMRIIDFGAQNETGAPALQLDENASQTPWSLKPFITYPKTVTIAKGKSTYVPISIKVPAEQGAGSYYGAIQYTAVNPETKQKVNISASSTTLVFLTVPGEANEKVNLKQFGAWQSTEDQISGQFKSMFVGASPKELAYRIQNSGNVAEQPSGSILVKNMFGRTVKEIKDANPKRSLALIGQTRRIQICMKESVLNSQDPQQATSQTKQAVCDDPGLWPGKYTAQVALFYGLNGSNTQELQATTSFWYFPWWSIVGFIVLVLIILGMTFLIRRAFGNSRRRYRR